MKKYKITLLYVLLLVFFNCNNSNINEIVITSDDYMRFYPNKINVIYGTPVKLTLKHIGKMNKNEMGHNFVLLKKNVDIMDFGSKAAIARDNDYIPYNSDQIIINTKMIGGGESITIEFLPPEIGTYDFICSFPGHYTIMKGKFIVK